MNIIKVRNDSNTGKVAGAIAGTIRDNRYAEVQAIGIGSVNSAIKSIALARKYLFNDGLDIVSRPEFVEIAIEENIISAIKIHIFPITAPKADILFENIKEDLSSQDRLEETLPDQAQSPVVNQTADQETLKPIRVAKYSPTGGVASAIANAIRENPSVNMDCIGGEAVNNGVKAIMKARDLLNEEGIDIVFQPKLIEITIDGKIKTMIRFKIYAWEEE